MGNLKLYEVDPDYISYLSAYAPHLFHNKKPSQSHSRKFIGVVLYMGGFAYFAPLSSFKEKHRKMKSGLDFIKIKDYAVINLNNMFPVPPNQYTYVNINLQKDLQYKNLLLAEYRIIKSLQEKICKNAKTLYQIKLRDGNTSALAKRCNDFILLENACKSYHR